MRRFEYIIPVFVSCMGALILSAILTVNSNTVPKQAISHEVAEEDPVEIENIRFFTRIRAERGDMILELYRDPKSQGRVFEFFTGICDSPEIAEVILYNAHLFNISPALAVALAWEESRLNPAAVNNRNRNKSIDRGLFQLNNQAFPRLETQAFFNPETNAWYAMNHLRYCLDAGGSEVSALAMYNAGPVRVDSERTPKSTLNYISRIMENRWEIENRFRDREALFQEQREFDPLTEIADAVPEHSFLVPLMPLVGKK